MPSLIQNTHADIPSGSPPVVLTPGAATTNGNLLVVTGYYYDSTAVSLTITDTATNTWTIGNTMVQAQNPPVGLDTGDAFSAFVAWVLNAAPVTSVTVGTSGSSVFGCVFTLSEWSGLTSRTDSSAANGASGIELQPAALTLATSSDVVIGAGRQQFGAGSPVAPLTGFSSDTSGVTAYAQPGSAGTYTPDWGSTSHGWAAAAAAFTAGSGTNAAAGNAASSGAVTAAASTVRIGMTIRGQ